MTSAQGVTAAELGAFLDVDEQTVRRLAREKIVARVGHGRYALVPSIKGYVVHLRRVAEERLGTDATLDPVTESALLSRAKARWFALMNKRIESTHVDVADLPRAWEVIVAVIRRAEENVLAQVRRALPHLSAHDLATVAEVLREQIDDAGLTDEPPRLS